jgi:hypothetical protein
VDFPTFRIEDETLPIMLCGSSPFLGLGYFGFKAVDYRIKFYQHPDTMADIFVHFVRKGCRGVHILCYDNILKAVKIAYAEETFPITASLITTRDVSDQLKALSRLESVVVFVDPSQTDSLNKKFLRDITKRIRNVGMIPGLATYQPGTSIPQLDQMDIDFSVYLIPFNTAGKYMLPNKEKTLQAVEYTNRKIVASRPLAGGILPEKGLPFVMKHCDGFCLGFVSKNQIDDAYRVLNQLT